MNSQTSATVLNANAKKPAPVNARKGEDPMVEKAMDVISAAARAGNGGSLLGFATYIGQAPNRNDFHDAIKTLKNELPKGAAARAELASDSIKISSIFDGSCYRPEIKAPDGKGKMSIPKELCLLEERLG